MCKKIIRNGFKIIQPSESDLKNFSKKCFHHSIKRKCELCEIEYDHFTEQSTKCGLCKIYGICKQCGEEYEIKYKERNGIFKKILFNDILNGTKEFEKFCSRSCSTKYKSNKGKIGCHVKYCDYCNKNTMHNGNRCYECNPPEKGSAWNNKYCKVCGIETLHMGNKCCICYPWKTNGGYSYKYCDKCKKKTLHINGSRCYECNKWIITTGAKLKYCNNCKRDTMHFGNRCYICQPWDNGYSGPFAIYKRNDDGKIIKVKDLLWEYYIKDYIIENSFNFKNENFYKINFDESEIFSGYPKLSWQQRFTEVCDGLKQGDWIVYIKYYINKDNLSKPLVVGKTGHNNANKTGTDVVFDYDYNKDIKRPARQFLEENNLKWDKSFIDFKCFKTEQEALDYENYIIKKYKLLSC